MKLILWLVFTVSTVLGAATSDKKEPGFNLKVTESVAAIVRKASVSEIFFILQGDGFPNGGTDYLVLLNTAARAAFPERPNGNWAFVQNAASEEAAFDTKLKKLAIQEGHNPSKIYIFVDPKFVVPVAKKKLIWENWRFDKDGKPRVFHAVIDVE